MEPASYTQVHRYDGAAVERGRRGELVPIAVQPRDLRLLEAVRSYRFLTSDQLLELFWPGARPQAGKRRLLKLFNAGHLERFRPVALRGSFPWTYHLGREGHRLLQDAGGAPQGERYIERAIYDYGRVVHDLQLNGWVLAYRRALADGLLRWEGETDIEPPKQTRSQQLRLDDNWSAEGLRDPKPRLIRPDATLELAGREKGTSHTFLIEHDRTRRVDKNYDKFRRYDTFLCWWWKHTSYGDREAPFVLFICQDEDQRDLFLAAADRELTGHLWHPSVAADQYVYMGRRRVLFACELDMHNGRLEAIRLPSLPPRHPRRRGSDAEPRRVRLPGHPDRSAAAA